MEKKLEILKRIDRGTSLSANTVEFGVGESIRTKRGREERIKFSSECCDYSALKKHCILRKADDETFDRAMHLYQPVIL